MNLLYIAEDGLFSNVFDSQVEAFLKALQPYVAEVHLIVLEPFKNRGLDLTAVATRLRKLEHTFASVHHHCMPPSMGYLTALVAARKVLALARERLPMSPNVIHARGHIGSYIAVYLRNRLFPKAHVVADLRGLPRHEALLKSPNFHKTLIAHIRNLGMDLLEGKVCHNSDAVFCVSNSLAQRTASRHRLPASRFTVIPCLTDTSTFFYDPELRSSRRHQLHLEDRLVLVFSGGMQTWQMPSRVLEIFESVRRNKRNAHLLFLTRNPAAAGSLLQHLPQTDYTLVSAAHTDVNAYLNAADIALLPREDHIVNRVACPVKLGEYLCAGLPLIASRCIGDIESTMSPFGVCELLENGPPYGIDIDRLLALERDSIHDIGVDLFGLDIGIRSVVQIYRRMRHCAEFAHRESSPPVN